MACIAATYDRAATPEDPYALRWERETRGNRTVTVAVEIWNVYRQQWSRYDHCNTIPHRVLASLSEHERQLIERELPQ